MKRKIMVVDDEYTIRELVSMSLEPYYDVIKAEDGTIALNMIKDKKPDLVILDIMMPKVDGYEVCRRLKANSETEKIPIIMLTAKHQEADLKRAIDVNVDEYITKPFEPDVLKRRVDAYFSQRATQRKLFKYGKSMHYIRGSDLA